MRIYLSWGDYPKFLKWFYGANPALRHAPYNEQFKARGDCLFGTMDAYSHNFIRLGHQATEFFVNNSWMQAAWAREHGLAVPQEAGESSLWESDSGLVRRMKTTLRPWRNSLRPLANRLGLLPQLDDFLTSTLRAQIEDFRPDLVINDNIEMISGKLIRESAPGHCFIIGQHGLDLPKGLDLSPYDLMISILSWVVTEFRARGVHSEEVGLGFEASILDRLGPAHAPDISVSLSCGLTAGHGKRVAMLEAVAERFSLQLWGPSLAGIPASSPLHACYQGEAWGRDMYDILRRSRITLNSHHDASRGEPVNMRMYEATGVGTFLLSDNVFNPATTDRFRPGEHVAGYTDAADCLASIERYLGDDGEREQIAASGQANTLHHHTYRNRASEIFAHAARYQG